MNRSSQNNPRSDRGFSDLFQSASSLLNSSTFSSHSQQQQPPSSGASYGPGKKKPSYNEMMSSTQVLLQAAKAKMHKGDGEEEEAEIGKIAGAAGNVLGAVAHYGKLEEGKYGKYIHKAEEYLHNYELKQGGSSAMGVNTPQGVAGRPPSQVHSIAKRINSCEMIGSRLRIGAGL